MAVHGDRSDVDEQGRLIGMFAYAWDVSAQRHAEQAQREAQAAAEAANRRRASSCRG